MEMCSLVRRVHISTCFWEIRTSDSTFQRWKTIQTVTKKKCKNQPLWWYGGASVPTAWVICIYVKVPLIRRLMLEFLRDICCHQDYYFSQELHVYFSRTMQGLILHELQQHDFIGIECVWLTGLPAVQICLLLKMYGASWRGGGSDNGLLSSSSLVSTKNATCKTATINIFSSKWLQSVIKEKVKLASGKHASVPTFFECVAGINFTMCLYLTKRIKWKYFLCPFVCGSSEWTNYRF